MNDATETPVPTSKPETRSLFSGREVPRLPGRVRSWNGVAGFEETWGHEQESGMDDSTRLKPAGVMCEPMN